MEEGVDAEHASNIDFSRVEVFSTMANSPLPTLDEVFEITETDEKKGYILGGVLLKNVVNDKVSKIRDDPLDEDEWTAFAEGIAAWAQGNTRTEWNKASATPIAILIAVGGNPVLSNADDLVAYASSPASKKEFFDKLRRIPREALEAKIHDYRLATARAKLTGLNMGAVREDSAYVHCPSGQKSPSDLGKETNTPEGAGFMIFNEYDPSPAKTVHAALLPASGVTDEIQHIAHVLQANSYTRGLLPLKENSSVQPRYNLFAPSIGFTAQTSAVKYSICGSPSAATNNGVMDGSFSMVSPYFSGERWALAVWENKGEEASLFLAARQSGPAYGFGIATFLAGIGIPVNNIVVPIILYTGLQIQFGAVFVLGPSFPVYTQVSRPFDLSRESDALQAARRIAKILEHCKNTEKEVSTLLAGLEGKLPNDAFSTMQMSLDKNQYFLKAVAQAPPEETSKAFGLVGEDGVAEYGSYHMIRIFNQLDKNVDEPTKGSICFPVCYREKFASDPLMLVFENLSNQAYEGGPYSVGFPPEKKLWPKWIEAVEAVVSAIHEAGVVHVDLYPSNIMWRPCSNGEGVEIKLIDFDVAHLKSERRWKEDVHSILETVVQGRTNLGWSMPEGVHEDWDMQYVCLLRHLVDTRDDEESGETMKPIWDDLSSGDVDRINAAFRQFANSTDIGPAVKQRRTMY